MEDTMRKIKKREEKHKMRNVAACGRMKDKTGSG